MPEEFRDSTDAGAGDAIDNAVDIGAVAASAPEPGRTPGKRRGPKPGFKRAATGASKEKTSRPLDLSSVVGLFVGIHVLLAAKTGVEELSMDMEEGQTLATAGQNVLRHYPVETTQKAVDWMALFGAFGMVYGTRVGSYALRKRREKIDQQNRNVYPMPIRTAPQPRETPQQTATQEQHFEVTPEYEGE